MKLCECLGCVRSTGLGLSLGLTTRKRIKMSSDEDDRCRAQVSRGQNSKRKSGLKQVLKTGIEIRKPEARVGCGEEP